MDRNEKMNKIKEVLEYLGITYDVRGEDEDFTMFFDDDEGIFSVMIDSDNAVILQFDVFMLPPRAAILTETFVNFGITPDFYGSSYVDSEGEMHLEDESEDIRDKIIDWGEAQLEMKNIDQNYVQ